MTFQLIYCFHVASTGSVWHDQRPLRSMRRRKTVKPEFRRRFSSKNQAAILSRLDTVARRPVAIALSLAVSAAIIGYIMLRSPGTPNQKSRRTLDSRSSERQSGNVGLFPSAPVFKASVIAEFNHDPDAFTQGLVFHDGFFYESTGLVGKSSVRKVEATTGRVVDARSLRTEDFGEGLALTGQNMSTVVQVIWKVGKAYVYDRESLREMSSFSFEGDAWGLASHTGDFDKLFLSDGTSNIKLVQFEGNRFRTIREITVRDGTREVGLLNELEVVGNELWANVWMSDFVARINIETGTVKSWVDLRGILPKRVIPHGHNVDVLNGIAHDPVSKAVYVTGKQWPKLYRISVTNKRIADDISAVTNAFFLNPDQVAYVHRHVIA